MHVLITASAHFAITPDGALWTPNGSLGYRFWARYLDVFDEARCWCGQNPRQYRRKAGRGPPAPASRRGLCRTRSALGYRDGLARIARTIRTALRASGAASKCGSRATSAAKSGVGCRKGDPYGVEVVADPFDVFAPGAVRHPLRPFLRRWFPAQLRQQCAGACGAAYVTERRFNGPVSSRSRGSRPRVSSVELAGTLLSCRPAPGLRPTGVLGHLDHGGHAWPSSTRLPDVLLDAWLPAP